jgi:PKD repeat protein
MNSINNPVTSIVNTPQCYNQSTGIISADMGSGNYTFVWKDANYNILQTTNGVSKDTLKNILAGTYYVEVSDGACGVSTQQVQLTANIGAPVIDFTTNADTLPVNTPFQFTNNSQNLTSFVWDFGDGTTSTATNPTHSYTIPGDYLVILEGVNACGDTLSIFKEITVTTVTGLNPNGVPTSPNLIVSRDKKGYFVTANYTKDTKVNLMVTDILGRTLIKETVILGNNKKVYLNNLPSQQIVVIRAEDGYSVINQKIIVED